MRALDPARSDTTNPAYAPSYGGRPDALPTRKGRPGPNSDLGAALPARRYPRAPGAGEEPGQHAPVHA